MSVSRSFSSGCLVAAGFVVDVLPTADRGLGIPSAEREQIFHRFWRRDRRRAGSAGLGLAIASVSSKCPRPLSAWRIGRRRCRLYDPFSRCDRGCRCRRTQFETAF
jgi:hypothetical protein